MKRLCTRPWMFVWIPVLAAGLLAGAAARENRLAGQESAVAKSPADAAAIDQAKSVSHAFRLAADAVSKSVVKIRSHTKAHALSGTSAQVENPFKGTPFEHMIPNLPEFNGQTPQHDGVGSGVIIDKAGIVLTNNHVVRGADEVTVVLADGTEYKAVDIKTDAQTDLAVLRLQGAHDLPAARLGNSDAMEVGDWVIAIGCPFQLDQTVSHGIISLKGRELNDINRTRLLQTDAAINPGNSGGPLVNLDGEVIGINTAIASSSGGFQGIGFSIPINAAKWVMGQLMTSGHVSRSYVGVQLEDISAELAEKLGVKQGEGVLVADVVAGAPAAAAGVHEGDVITGFSGTKVHSSRELRDLVEKVPVDSKQTLEILRDGKPMTLTLMTKTLPDRLAARMAPGEKQEEEKAPGASVKADELGLEVADMTTDEAKTYTGYDGVIIRGITPEGPAARKGLEPGMLIRKVGRTEVKNVQQFEEALKHESTKSGVLLNVHTPTGNLFVVLQKS